MFSVLSYEEIFLTVLEKLIGAESLAFLDPLNLDFSNLTTWRQAHLMEFYALKIGIQDRQNANTESSDNRSIAQK